MRHLTFFLCLIFTLAAAKPTKKTVLKLDPDRTISVVGAITGEQTGRIMQLAVMALTSNEPINILIDSPGGLVDGGQLLMEAMQKLTDRDVEINCIVKRAQSMAMYMLVNCTNVYGLPNSVWLWHPVRASLGRPITAAEADDMAKELHEMDDLYNPPLRHALGMEMDPYNTAWEAEKNWERDDLMSAAPKFLIPIDAISGVEFPAEVFDPRMFGLPTHGMDLVFPRQ